MNGETKSFIRTALFKLKSDFLVHNPEVKTWIHVFDHTIKPILLYGCEIWGYFNPFTSRFRNGNIPIDQILDNMKQPAAILVLQYWYTILVIPVSSSICNTGTDTGKY